MHDELVDSELCEVYGWSWRDLQETPAYVRTVFWQIQQMKRAARAQANDAARAPAGQQRIPRA